MKLLIVFGTRPEAIKMAPLVKELQKSNQLEVKVCVTAQHRQMLDQVLQLFDITPDFDLNLMRPGQTLTQLTCNILQGMESVFAQYKPDYVLVHGDTSTTLGTSLAAYYQQVKVAHIEAGLRTHNLYSPWPEEANRQITGRLADLHFAPTPQAKANLLQESVNSTTIHVTGNTVIDALISVSNRLDQDAVLHQQLADQFPFLDSSKRLVLVTGQRDGATLLNLPAKQRHHRPRRPQHIAKTYHRQAHALPILLRLLRNGLQNHFGQGTLSSCCSLAWPTSICRCCGWSRAGAKVGTMCQLISFVSVFHAHRRP